MTLREKAEKEVMKEKARIDAKIARIQGVGNDKIETIKTKMAAKIESIRRSERAKINAVQDEKMAACAELTAGLKDNEYVQYLASLEVNA